MKKALRWVIIVVGVLLVGAQFIRPDRTNPSADLSKDFAAIYGQTSTIVPLIRKACYDCHSSETRWPWYSNITPVSWFVSDDVREARRHLNFSTWGDYPARKRASSLDHIRDEVSSGDMPMWTYLLMHSDAHLTQGERDSIVSWAEREKKELANE